MKQHEEFLKEYDQSYEEFRRYLQDKNYSEATSVQGYLTGMIMAARILSNTDTDVEFVKEITDRANILF